MRESMHHSDGATWIEQCARPLGLAGDVRPALRSQGKASNYAYGGARARPHSKPVVIPNQNERLPDQISQFLADVNESAAPDALYVVFIGANDIFDAVVALSIDARGALSGQTIEVAVASVATEVERLIGAGAQNIVVLNAPDLGPTPVIRLVAAAFGIPTAVLQGAATDLSEAYNGGLELALGSIPGVRIIDVMSEFRDIVADPGEFGLTNIEDPCVMPEQPPYVCRNPDQYLFWDTVHPTTAAHGIIAEFFADQLTM